MYNVSMRKSYINRKPIAIAIGIVIVFTLTLVYEFAIKKNTAVSSVNDGVFYAQFIDIGQGDSTLLSSTTGEYVLIDAGPGSSKKVLVEYLKNAGVDSIEYMILTHPHEDHIGGAAAVLEAFEVKNVIMPDATTDTSVFRNTLKAIESEGCKTILAEPGKVYDFGESKLEILGPFDTEGKDLNNTSVVCKITHGDCSFMFTGDMEKDYERELIDRYSEGKLSCDVLKVGHHGSSTSSCDEFLDAVDPFLAVISCSEDNEYGHPHS